MSNNPITTSGALAIIYSVKLNNSSILEKLELSVKFGNCFIHFFKFNFKLF